MFKAAMKVAADGIQSQFGPQIAYIGRAVNWVGNAIVRVLSGFVNLAIKSQLMLAEVITDVWTMIETRSATHLQSLRFRLADIWNTDYAGDFLAQVGKVAGGLARTRRLADEAGTVAKDAWETLRDVVVNTGTAMDVAFQGVANWDAENAKALEKLQEMEQLGQRIGAMFSDALASMIEGTKSFNEALSDVMRSLGRMAMNAAFQGLFGGLFGGGFGGGFGAGLGTASAGAGIGSAMGGGSSQIAGTGQRAGTGGFAPTINVNGAGNPEAVAQAVERQLRDYVRFRMPADVNRINNDPLLRGAG